MMVGRLLMSLTAVFFLAACSGDINLEEPPEIRYGEDVCEQCGMIISEARFAASYVTTAGDVHLFDDVGGMLMYDVQNQEEVHSYWAHDFNTEEWMRADTAVYVLNDDLATPMGWGLAAFANGVDAEQFMIENGGTLTTWDDLHEGIAAGNIKPGSLSNYINQNE
jgi:copper chaperone NosL